MSVKAEMDTLYQQNWAQPPFTVSVLLRKWSTKDGPSEMTLRTRYQIEPDVLSHHLQPCLEQRTEILSGQADWKAIREAIETFDHLQARAEEAEAVMRKAQAQAQAAVPA